MSQKIHRRTILQSIVAVAATTAFGCSDEETTEQQAERARAFFPQSVASGDPRPDSVVLWTRCVNEEHGGDTTLTLEVSTDDSFGQLVLKQDGLTATADHDNAIKVKVTNLTARTTYYYRFVYEHDGERFLSPVGRTKTAPAAGSDVPVKFVIGSCQDYVGRYYNTWQRLLQLDADVDAIIFLGDYIYETTGDPAFQSTNTLREIKFTETDKAILQKTGPFQYYAAQAVSNYRDIYKTLRSDPVIQKVHERYPFINMWDDHEFSNDSWGSTATYTNGRKDEKQDERKRNAEQAFFEYIPLDANPAGAAAGAIDVNTEPKYPNTHIYRDFEFGKHVKLIVADYRTYRPDHVIPEDAYPGTVVMDEATLTAVGALPAFASDLFAYVDIDAAEYEPQRGVLSQAYVALAQQAGLSATEAQTQAGKWVKGKLSVAYINQVLAAAGAPSALQIGAGGKPKGLAYVHMGKLNLFDVRGTRNIVVKDTFDLYAGFLYATTQKASENALGNAQEAWLKDQVKATNTWKLIVSSVSLSALILDLRTKTDIPDASLRQRFYFTTDQWDGFPTKKKELLGYVKANATNPVFISGDIHASFASVEEGVPTLTAPSISSSSIKEEASTAVQGAGYAPGSPIFRYIAVETDQTLRAGNAGLAFTDTDSHGFLLVEARPTELLATYHLIPSSEVHKDYSKRADEELTGKFTTRTLRVQNSTITSG